MFQPLTLVRTISGQKSHWADQFGTTLCGKTLEFTLDGVRDRMCILCAKAMLKMVWADETVAHEVNSDWNRVILLESSEGDRATEAGELRELMARRGFAPPPFAEHRKNATTLLVDTESWCLWERQNTTGKIRVIQFRDGMQMATPADWDYEHIWTAKFLRDQLGLKLIELDDLHAEALEMNSAAPRVETCPAVDMMRLVHEEAIILHETRELQRWVSDAAPGSLTDWPAVLKYLRKREQFAPDEWSRIAAMAADYNAERGV